jgi:glycosyltransferase involved in cell wall biosynthesis
MKPPMHRPKVSVIVAVYNAELFIHRCLDSLLRQTLPDFEILLIDDGSTDSSKSICDEYAAKDSRIRLFHKSNGGVASARQMGLDNMIGEYSIHVDSDDWVEPTMLEELHTKAKADNADMVICDFYYEREEGKTIYSNEEPASLDGISVIEGFCRTKCAALWNKLIRTACYKAHDIFFHPDVNLCEDFLVNVKLLSHDIRVSYLPKAFYHYVRYGNAYSITRSTDDKLFVHRLLIFRQELLKLLSSLPVNEKTCHYINVNYALSIARRNGLKRKEYMREFGRLKNLYRRLNVGVLKKVALAISFIHPYLIYILWILKKKFETMVF